MTEPVLARSIGLGRAVGFGLGAMVGTGVFVYTGIGAGLAGPAVLASLGLAALAAASNGLASAELAAVHPRAGGTYEYAGRRLSPWAGFIAGWLFLAAKTTSAAATALGLGAYLGAPLPVALGLVAAGTLLTLLRLGRIGALNLALVAVSVAALSIFVAAEAPRISLDRFAPFAPRGLGGVLQAAALLFVAYAGYGRVATLGEEIENPRRNIPLAVVLTLAAATLLYFLVTATAVGAVGAEAFAAGNHLRAAASSSFVRVALAVGAGTALVSVFLNLQLGISRMFFAMARGGELPRGLAALDGASTPWVAVLATGAIVGGLVLIQSVLTLVSLSAFAVLVYYALTNLSALRLSKEERLVHPAVPAAGLVFCLALAASVPWKPLAAGLGVLAAGILWRLIRSACARPATRP